MDVIVPSLTKVQDIKVRTTTHHREIPIRKKDEMTGKAWEKYPTRKYCRPSVAGPLCQIKSK